MAAQVSTDYDCIELPGIPELHFFRGAETCLNRQVQEITVVVGDDVSDTCCNHWRFFVSFNESDSVCLDMVIEEGSKHREGYCGAVRKKYNLTRSYFKCFSMLLRDQPFTFRDVVDALKVAGIFRYRYPSENDGCRFWVSEAIATLEKDGFLVPPSAQNVRAQIDFTWTEKDGGDTTKQAVKAAHGTFY